MCVATYVGGTNSSCLRWLCLIVQRVQAEALSHVACLHSRQARLVCIEKLHPVAFGCASGVTAECSTQL